MKFSKIKHALVDHYNDPAMTQRVRDLCMTIVLDGLDPNDFYEIRQGNIERKYPGVTMKVQKDGDLERWIIAKKLTGSS